MKKRENKKYALLFGTGRESYQLLDKYKKYQPTLITRLGKKDSVNERAIYDIAKRHGLKAIVVNGRDHFCTATIVRKQKFIKFNVNIPKDILKEYDVIVCGRKRTDFIKRTFFTAREIPKEFNQTNNIICPLYNQ